MHIRFDNTFGYVITNPISLIVFLGVFISIIFCVLSIVSSKYQKNIKTFLIINSIFIIATVIDTIWSVAGVGIYTEKNITYYLDYICNIVMNFAPLILIGSWIVLFVFYKKIKKHNS